MKSISTSWMGLIHRGLSPALFLAPDIVESILDGRQPLDLTVQKVTSKLPHGWMKQRQQLGFAEPRQRT